MTYYEELGILPSASVEEIRHAYRRLVRLVHPDQCTDEETRRLAELQMMRLNGVLAVLTDDVQRAKYDVSLTAGRALPYSRRSVWVLIRQREFVYGLGAVLVLGMALILWPRRPATPTPLAAPVSQTPSAAPPKKPRYQQPRPRPQLIVSVARPASLPDAPAMAPTPSPPEPQPVLPIEPVTSPAPPAESSLPATLTGRWLFVPSLSKGHVGYPPEYIELRLTESAGVLHGRYQARYRVTDRAISPNVAFRFDGHAGAEGGLLPWHGPAGAQGEITLHLLPTGNLEVDWVAHQLGQEMALISGTATLVRRLE